MHNNLKTQHHPKYQRGATLIGAAMVIGLVLFIAVVAMKMLPAYTEFMAVKKVIRALEGEQLSEMSKKEVIDSFNKRTRIDDIKSITGQDLVIEKDEAGNTVVSVEYQVVQPIMGNVSALIDFKASSEDK